MILERYGLLTWKAKWPRARKREIELNFPFLVRSMCDHNCRDMAWLKLEALCCSSRWQVQKHLGHLVKLSLGHHLELEWNGAAGTLSVWHRMLVSVAVEPVATQHWPLEKYTFFFLKKLFYAFEGLSYRERKWSRWNITEKRQRELLPGHVG